MTCISVSLKGLLLCGDERSGAVITCTIKQIFLPSQWLCPREAPLRCHTTFHSKDIISQTPSPKSFWFIRPENRFYCVQSFKFIRKLHTVCQVALTQSGFRLAASPQRPEWWSATETVILPARSFISVEDLWSSARVTVGSLVTSEQGPNFQSLARWPSL